MAIYHSTPPPPTVPSDRPRGQALRERAAPEGTTASLTARASLRAIAASPDPGPPADAQLNTRILACPLRYVQENFGDAQLDSTLRQAGGDPAVFAPPYGWISHPLFERVLEGIRALVPSDREFVRACAYKLKEVYGPFALLFRVASIKQAFRVFSSTSHLASRISRFEVSDLGRGHIRIRYTSSCAESRLMCLSRQAQNQRMPMQWWGVPTPKLEEHTCIAWGDPNCTYDLRWREPIRWSRAALGSMAGASIGGAALLLGAAPWIIAPLAIVGLGAAWLLESRRIVDENQNAAQDTSAALLELAESQQEATAELIDLHRRQQLWNQELENLVAARTATLETIVEQLRGLRQTQHTRVRSLSHDIRNPISVLKASALFIREELGDIPETVEPLLADLEDAANRTHLLLEELAKAATTEQTATPSPKEVIEMSVLAATLRRRLRALVLGRDIRSTVFQTREAPTAIRADAVLLDRVLDNLLTNAAKYTERGSILVELDGTPGHLCARISDTGRGISADRMETVFTGTTPDAAPLFGTSIGLGLSVVVRTLAQLEGRLEVMSRPGQGTTLWLYIPVEPTPDSATSSVDDEPIADLARRVIRIREAM